MSLVPDIVFDRDFEGAVGKAVSFGLAEGKPNFRIVLFSILNVMLLEVHAEDSVKMIRRTSVIPIYDARIRSGTGFDPERCENTGFVNLADNPREQLYINHRGFVYLQNFFRTASPRYLSRFSPGLFPWELYSHVIAQADLSTRNICQNVSQSFRELCQKSFPFSHNYTILAFKASTKYENSRQSWCSIDLSTLGAFHIKDESTGRITRAVFDVAQPPLIADEEKVTTWCPIIGGTVRPCMMTQLSLRLSL